MPDDIAECPQPLQPSPIIIDNQEEYEVEEVLDSRFRWGKLWYLVKFIGWSHSDNMWLPHTVRVRPCISNSTPSPMHLQSISKALLCTLMHCVSDSACYTTPHHPLHLHLHLFVCLSVSPSGLFPLIDGQWTSAKSNCTHSIRRGLSRRLRSSLLLNSSPSTSRDHPLVT